LIPASVVGESFHRISAKCCGVGGCEFCHRTKCKENWCWRQHSESCTLSGHVWDFNGGNWKRSAHLSTCHRLTYCLPTFLTC